LNNNLLDVADIKTKLLRSACVYDFRLPNLLSAGLSGDYFAAGELRL
jgi:hypothetical protein